jgi:tetratricopeptide (TPR) repeat protein
VATCDDNCSPRQLQRRLVLLLLGFTLAVFSGVCGHEFVQLDDNMNIYGNPHIQGLTWEHLKWMFAFNPNSPRYMPLGWLSYAVDYQLFGLNPQAFHAVNLFLHLCNVVLLFFLLKRLVLLARADGEEPTAAAIWCAAIGALFWAINPLRVEVVAWASARIYAMAFLFTTLSWLAWLRAQDPATPKERRRLFYWLSVAAYAVSLFTYPLAMFAPVALLVLEVYRLRRLRIPWRDKIPFLGLAATVVFITFAARVGINPVLRPVSLHEFGMLPRIMQAFYIWAYYVWKPWAPYDLAAVYSTLHSFNPLGLPFLASAGLVMGVSLALVILWRRWPGALGLWLCHLAILVPFLGLSEYPHCPYDRYSHLHGILWSVAIALLLRMLWERGKAGYLAGTVVAGAALLFALPAWQQVSVWSGTITLHENVLRRLGEHPSRARYDEVLGIHYLHCGLTNEAVASFQNVLYYESRRADRQLYQDRILSRTRIRLGDICADQGSFDQALAHYRTALELDVNSVNALLNIGATLGALNRDAEAIKTFEAALKMKPNSSQAHHNLALVLRKIGRETEAEEHFREERRLSVNSQ